MKSEYEKEFQIFSNNVNQAARSFYYHTEIQKQVYEDCSKQENDYFQYSKMYQAIDANAQFWNDYKYSSLFHAIVTLGRIFDRNKKSHGIRRLVKIAKQSGSFTTHKLRERKIKDSDNASEWIDEYMYEKQDIGSSEYFKLLRYVVETINMWQQVKGVRNKLYAHQDVMTDTKRQSILETATYGTLEDIIKRLLTIEHIYWQAYYNGASPDLGYKNEQVLNRVQKDVTALLKRLI